MTGQNMDRSVTNKVPKQPKMKLRKYIIAGTRGNGRRLDSRLFIYFRTIEYLILCICLKSRMLIKWVLKEHFRMF